LAMVGLSWSSGVLEAEGETSSYELPN